MNHLFKNQSRVGPAVLLIHKKRTNSRSHLFRNQTPFLKYGTDIHNVRFKMYIFQKDLNLYRTVRRIFFVQYDSQL